MPFTYDFERDAGLLHIVVTGPAAVRDYQDIMPRIIGELRDAADVLMLVEIREFAPDERTQDHDLGFFFINEIKEAVAKLAIVCPDALRTEADELVQIIRNHRHNQGRNDGGAGDVFSSVEAARAWLTE